MQKRGKLFGLGPIPFSVSTDHASTLLLQYRLICSHHASDGGLSSMLEEARKRRADRDEGCMRKAPLLVHT